MITGTFIAGGTTLVDLMKLGVETLNTLTDLVSEGEFPSQITQTADGLLIVCINVRSSPTHLLR